MNSPRLIHSTAPLVLISSIAIPAIPSKPNPWAQPGWTYKQVTGSGRTKSSTTHPRLLVNKEKGHVILNFPKTVVGGRTYYDVSGMDGSIHFRTIDGSKDEMVFRYYCPNGGYKFLP